MLIVDILIIKTFLFNIFLAVLLYYLQKLLYIIAGLKKNILKRIISILVLVFLLIKIYNAEIATADMPVIRYFL